MTAQPRRFADHSAITVRPRLPETSVEELLRRLCRPAPAQVTRDTAISACRTAFPALLTAASSAKVLPLIAAQLTAPVDAPTMLPESARSRLLAVLWASHDNALTARVIALAVVDALDKAKIAAAAVHGLAHEHTLYPGDGSRQVGDLDFLIRPHDLRRAGVILAGLGYQPLSATRFKRKVDDTVVDLGSRPHLSGTTLTALLTRRGAHRLPPTLRPLPILQPGAALVLALAQVGVAPPDASSPLHLYADIARLLAAHPDVVARIAGLRLAPVRAGWARLHSVWPDLVPATAAPGPRPAPAPDSSAPPVPGREAAPNGAPRPPVGTASRPTSPSHRGSSRRRAEVTSS